MLHLQDAALLTQKVQITAFQSVSTAVQPAELPDVNPDDIGLAMASANTGVGIGICDNPAFAFLLR